MFERLGSLTYRLRFLIVVAWVVAAVLCARFAPSLAGQGSTDQASFLPSGTPSVQARDALEKAFPGSTSASSATLTFERATGLTDADLAYLDAVAAWVAGADAPAELRAAVTSTDSATSRPELAKMLRSDDGRLELLVVNLDVQTAGDAAALVVDQLRDHLVATGPDHPGLETHVTGAAAISSDYLAAVRAGTESTTVVTVLLVIAVLLLIYRAPLAALVPLVTIGGAFVVSRGVLGFLAAAGWQVSSLLDTFLVVMVFGVGTDYAIFLISRYREEVAGGGDWHGAARSTVKRIGAVISASAATVIVGMTAMAFGDFQMIQSTGPALGVAIFVTLVAGLTLAPALLSIFGHYLFWPLHARPRPEGEPGGLFARLASAVSRRPGLVTVVLLAALLVPATYLPQVRTNFDVLAELPANADSRLGYDAIARRLGEDKLVQSTGIVDAGGGGDVLAPASLARLRDLMATLSSTPGVSTATSLVTPDGDGVVPDGFRPSAQLATIASDLEGDDANASGDSASLLDDTVSDGLDSALAYVDGLAVAFPDVAASPELHAVTSGIGDAQDIVARARRQSLLPTQLRTLASALTSPTSAATGSGSANSSASIMVDYLHELAAAYPEVKALPAFRDATAAAARLERKAALQPALDLSAALETLAVHFDGRPDATLSPTSLSGTASAREFRREAQATFDALPDRFAALAAVFAPRPDDIWIPTTLTGEDGRKVRDAVDAFVSGDRAATRFYLTSASDPYSGDAFAIVRAAQAVVSAAAPSFGAGAAGFLGGPTAQFADVQSTLSSDFERVGVITVIGILLVLMLLLRAVVAPLYLVATVLVSYASAVGLSSWLFQEVLGQPGISFYLPLMVFVLLVALGSDYNIFLMSRVREESETRPIRDGIRIASGHTGAVITSAGLILAGTFGSMATAPLAVLFQVGVAVAIGVLIDTFVVRSILVPAITTLVGDRAWWPSGAALAGLLRPVPAGIAPGSVALIGSVADGTGGAGGQRRSGGPAGAGRASWGRLAVALCLVVLVPVVAAGVLTWSFGHAASGAGGQTAAVVSLDSGATLTAPDGASETLRLGSDLVDELTAPAGGSGLAWVGADEGEAAAGLADGRYAAVLTIPADFSRTIAALRSDTSGRAARATLRLQGAAAAGGRAGSLPGAVARDVMAAIDATAGRGVTASYVEDVLLAVSDAHDQVAGAASKAGDVADATRHLSTGSRGLRRSPARSRPASGRSRTGLPKPGAAPTGSSPASGRSRPAPARSRAARPTSPRAHARRRGGPLASRTVPRRCPTGQPRSTRPSSRSPRRRPSSPAGCPTWRRARRRSPPARRSSPTGSRRCARTPRASATGRPRSTRAPRTWTPGRRTSRTAPARPTPPRASSRRGPATSRRPWPTTPPRSMRSRRAARRWAGRIRCARSSRPSRRRAQRSTAAPTASRPARGGWPHRPATSRRGRRTSPTGPRRSTPARPSSPRRRRSWRPGSWHRRPAPRTSPMVHRRRPPARRPRPAVRPRSRRACRPSRRASTRSRPAPPGWRPARPRSRAACATCRRERDSSRTAPARRRTVPGPSPVAHRVRPAARARSPAPSTSPRRARGSWRPRPVAWPTMAGRSTRTQAPSPPNSGRPRTASARTPPRRGRAWVRSPPTRSPSRAWVEAPTRTGSRRSCWGSRRGWRRSGPSSCSRPPGRCRVAGGGEGRSRRSSRRPGSRRSRRSSPLRSCTGSSASTSRTCPSSCSRRASPPSRSPRSSRHSSRTSATAAGCSDCCSSWCRPRQRDCPTPSRRCRDPSPRSIRSCR